MNKVNSVSVKWVGECSPTAKEPQRRILTFSNSIISRFTERSSVADSVVKSTTLAANWADSVELSRKGKTRGGGGVWHGMAWSRHGMICVAW